MKLCLLIFNLRLDFLCWKPFHLREVVAQENLTNVSKWGMFIQNYIILVYNKPVDGVFHMLWLTTQTQDSKCMCYPPPSSS